MVANSGINAATVVAMNTVAAPTTNGRAPKIQDRSCGGEQAHEASRRGHTHCKADQTGA